MSPIVMLACLSLAAPMQDSITLDQLKVARGDLLMARLGNAEGSLDAWKGTAFPFTGKAILGIPLGEEEVAVTPDGAVLAPLDDDRVYIQAFAPDGAGVRPMFTAADRSYPNPLYPAIKHSATRDGFLWTQKVYVTQELPGRDRVIIEIKCQNTSPEHRLVAPSIGFAWLRPASGDPTKAPTPREEEPKLTYVGVTLTSNRYLSALPRFAGVQKGGMDKPWKTHRFTLGKVSIEPGASESWVVSFGLYGELAPLSAVDEAAAWKVTAEQWNKKWKNLADYSVPEPQLVKLRMQLLAQLLIAADTDQMNYGAFPSKQDKVNRGVEEASALEALAMWGLGEDAMTLADGTLLSTDNLDREGPNREYRFGVAAWYAWSIYRLTADHIWLETAIQALRQPYVWLNEHRPAGSLLPAGKLDSDTNTADRGFWANAAVWRGFNDYSLALADRGYKPEAAKYAAAARDLREAISREFNAPPQLGFQPMVAGENPAQLVAPDEYARMADLTLRTGLAAKDVTLKFLAESGRIQAGIPMTNGAFDLAHSLGALLSRDPDSFLRTLYTMIALGCDPLYGTMPSSLTPLVSAGAASEQAVDQEERFRKTDEMNVGSAAAVLQGLRYMWAKEDEDSLALLWAIPERWYAQEKPFQVTNLPTAFGKVSLSVTPSATKVTYRFSLSGKAAQTLKSVRLRLPARAGSPVITGSSLVGPQTAGWASFEPAKEVVITVKR